MTSIGKQLQHLQSGHKLDRWVLKTGAHMWGLDHLLATYPDARIVFTHRDPVKSLTSYASLTALVREMGSDHVDKFEVAEDWNARLTAKLQQAVAIRAAKDYPDAVFYDMRFSDFVRDQFAVVQRIYAAFDLADVGRGRRPDGMVHRRQSAGQARHPPL